MKPCCQDFIEAVKSKTVIEDQIGFSIRGKPANDGNGHFDDMASEMLIAFCPFCGRRLHQPAGTRATAVYDRCTTEGCNKVLHSISEAERGKCSSCWVSSLKPETRKAMNKLIASAFNGSTEQQKEKAVDEAFAAMKNDKEAK